MLTVVSAYLSMDVSLMETTTFNRVTKDSWLLGTSKLSASFMAFWVVHLLCLVED